MNEAGSRSIMHSLEERLVQENRVFDHPFALGLAVNFSPGMIGMLIIDFGKGGGIANTLEKLPPFPWGNY